MTKRNWNWQVALNFARGFVRPWIAYLFSTVFAGLAVYAFVKYPNETIALALVSGFVSAAVALISFYAGGRATLKKEDK